MSEKQIVSPLPGVFYRRPTPDDPEFKKIGDQVAPDDVIGLVEVMKMFNQIKSDVEGTVVSFEVENEEDGEAGPSPGPP